MPKLVNDVLYFAPGDAEAVVREEMTAAGGRPLRGSRSKHWMVVAARSRACQFNLVHTADEAFTRLRQQYYHFAVVDVRSSHGGEPAQAMRFLERLHVNADTDLRCPAARVIAVLDQSEGTAARAFELGRMQIGSFVIDPFPAALFERMDQLFDPDPGKAAICLAGGGLEGFLFEIGVMKALNAHLQTRSVCDFEIFCGISAGSILAAFLANDVQPEDMEAAFFVDQKDLDGVEPVTPAVIYDPHVREYATRIWRLLTALPLHNWNEALSDLLKAVPDGFFQGEALRRFVESQLTRGGRSNDFRRLDRELYIGATDQDTSTHVVFGAGQWRDIPISTAVRASTALTPFFTPAKIRGRYFVDGQYTRTSNFHLAVERGAKLVVVVDPLVPVRVDLPGYVRKKGGVFAGLQALKAVIHTRFMRSFQKVAETHPHVDFLLFLPEGNDVRLMSGSPMKYNIRTEILNMAYRSAVRRIQRDFEVLRGTFAKHGFQLQRHPRMRTPYRKVS